MIFSALLISLSFAGCSQLADTIGDFIDNDANIGKNAPAVMGTIGDIEALNENTQKQESSGNTGEDKEAQALEEKRLSTGQRAQEILSGMTAKQKIGQLLLVRMYDSPAENMAKFQYGGYTLYSENFKNETPESIKELTSQIKKAAKVSPFIAVDEEGGTVVRVSSHAAFREEPFSSPQLLLNRGGTELLEMDAEEKARLLTGLGINLNLAPVADISTDDRSYIYPRTMGQGAEGTAEGVSAIVRVSASKRLASCLKHFPGYGENTDTHKDSSHDERELYEFYNRDFVPFQAGIDADGERKPAVMFGHTVYDTVDSNIPASLSPVWHGVLRERLGFDGVAITDDLGMDALGDYSPVHSLYADAVLAGNDMLCVSDGEEAFDSLYSAYENGIITDETLDEHVMRIIIMKLKFNIAE